MTTTKTTKRQPSPRAVATQSLTAAGRLKGKDRREALTKHAAMVWPSKSCSLVGHTTRF